MRTKLDDLTRKLADVEVAKDTTLRGENEVVETAKELKKIFHTDKNNLEVDKQKAKEALLANMAMSNKFFKVSLYWRDSYSH